MAMDMQSGGAKGGRAVRPTMNVTPLVDVVLVLLIIFMVVTPLLTKKMWMNVPPKPDERAATPPPDALPPLVVTVALDGLLRLNHDVVPADQLVARVRAALNARADKVVFFDAYSHLEYGRALATLDALRGGGVDTIAVLADALEVNQPEAPSSSATGSR